MNQETVSVTLRPHDIELLNWFTKAKSFVDNNEAAMLKVAYTIACEGRRRGELFCLRAGEHRPARNDVLMCTIDDNGLCWGDYGGATELFRLNCIAIISRDIFAGHLVTDKYDSKKEKWTVMIEFNFLPLAV